MCVNKKILISDYDQTFYLNDNDMEKNKIAIKEFREKGNLFVIAIGRSYFDFRNKAILYNIDYDYVIINHGATILDKQNNILANFPLKNEIIPYIKINLGLECLELVLYLIFIIQCLYFITLLKNNSNI